MKRKLSVLSITLLSALLVGCNDYYPTHSNVDLIEVFEEDVVEPIVVAAPVVDITPGPTTINTKVFEYARKVDVLDARELNKHLTVTVWMSGDVKQGQAANNVLGQAFYFIQQEDVEGADTITFGVMSGNTRVFQFTVDVERFEESANGSFVDDVLAASRVDKMSVDVARFAEAFEWRIAK